MRYWLLISSVLLASLHFSASAHRFSTAYLEVTIDEQQTMAIYKVSVHDLLHTQLISRADVRTANWQVLLADSQLSNYLAANMIFTVAQQSCDIKLPAVSALNIELIQEQRYVIFPLSLACADDNGWQLSYQAFMETGHNHKLILTWQSPRLTTQAVLSAADPLFIEQEINHEI